MESVTQKVDELLQKNIVAVERVGTRSLADSMTADGIKVRVGYLHREILVLGEVVHGLTGVCYLLAQEIDATRKSG
jgi:hypothetical protein